MERTRESVSDERLARWASCGWLPVHEKPSPDAIISMATELQQARARIAKLERRNAEQEQPTGQQPGAEIPPAVTDADIRAIQTIREAWNMVTDAELLDIKGYLGEGAPAYQFWLELHYARAAADLEEAQETWISVSAAKHITILEKERDDLRAQLAAAQREDCRRGEGAGSGAGAAAAGGCRAEPRQREWRNV